MSQADLALVINLEAGPSGRVISAHLPCSVPIICTSLCRPYETSSTFLSRGTPQRSPAKASIDAKCYPSNVA